MKKFQEVEVKYPLKNPTEVMGLLDGILSAEKKISAQYQLDIYFTPPHKNFLDNEIVSEWLRIRKTSKNSSVNFKRWLPLGAKIQTHCDEYEVSVDDIQPMEMIFSALDFKEIIRVEKTRNSWLLDGVEISIDVVEMLGAFIELEATEKVEESDIPATLDKLNNILNKLHAQIGEQDRRGYPYLLIELNKGENK